MWSTQENHPAHPLIHRAQFWHVARKEIRLLRYQTPQAVSDKEYWHRSMFRQSRHVHDGVCKRLAMIADPVGACHGLELHHVCTIAEGGKDDIIHVHWKKVPHDKSSVLVKPCGLASSSDAMAEYEAIVTSSAFRGFVSTKQQRTWLLHSVG